MRANFTLAGLRPPEVRSTRSSTDIKFDSFSLCQLGLSSIHVSFVRSIDVIRLLALADAICGFIQFVQFEHFRECQLMSEPSELS